MVRSANRQHRRDVYRPVNPDRIPSVIREKRKAAALTQRELARRLMVSQSLVAKWETGVRTPGGPELVDLMALLEFTRDEIS